MAFCSAERPLGTGFIPFGDTSVVIGTNDAGKTSLLRLVCNELDPGTQKLGRDPATFGTSTTFFVTASAAETRFLIGRLVSDRIQKPPASDDSRISRVVRDRLAIRAGVIDSDPEGWPLGGWDHEKLRNLALAEATPEGLAAALSNCAGDPAATAVAEALAGSHMFAFEAEHHSSHGWIWRVYWCLPPVNELSPELRQALTAAGFRQHASRSRPGRVQRWRPPIEQLQHLVQPNAPTVAAPVGRTTLQLLPQPIQVPADIAALRKNLEDLLGKFSAHVLQGPNGNWRGFIDSSPDVETDPWVADDERVSRVRPEIVSCASALSSSINRLLPPLIGDRYEVRLTIRPVSVWAHLERLEFEVAEDQGESAIPIAALAAGLQMWLQLAVFEAIHRFRATLQILEICRDDWVEARIDLDELESDDTSALEAERELTADELRPTLESEEQRTRTQWEEIAGAVMAGRMPIISAFGFAGLVERLETSAGDDRERRLIGLAASTMYLLDEPERHLHPLWHIPMADWLNQRIARNDEAQALIATHAVPFSDVEETSTLIHIWRAPGARSSVSALKRSELSALSAVALDVGWDRGQLMSTVAIWLFVEGRADQAVLQVIAGEELRTAGVAIIPLHGESRASGVLDSEIVLRYSSAAVAVWLDRVPAELVADLLADAKAAISISNDKSKTPEIRTMAKLVATAAEHGREVAPVPHPGADIFDLLNEDAIRQLFPTYPGHEAAHRAADEAGIGFKQHCQNAYGIRSDVAGLRRIAVEMVNRASPRHEAFDTVIETCRTLTLGRRLLG